jgi:Ca2+-transporting ATPase
MLIVAAFEARSETETVFSLDTFNSPRMNLIALAEVAGAFLITQADFMQRLLGTTTLTARQWGTGLLAAVVLLFAWELGKWIARRNPRPERPRADAMATVDAGARGELEIDINGR